MTPHEHNVAKLRDLLACIANLDSETNGKDISNDDTNDNLNMAVECAQEALDLLDEVVT